MKRVHNRPHDAKIGQNIAYLPFLMGVGLFVDVLGARPAEGVLAGDGLAVEELVLAADGVDFDEVIGVLDAAGEADFGAAETGRVVVVPVEGLEKY